MDDTFQQHVALCRCILWSTTCGFVSLHSVVNNMWLCVVAFCGQQHVALCRCILWSTTCGFVSLHSVVNNMWLCVVAFCDPLGWLIAVAMEMQLP